MVQLYAEITAAFRWTISELEHRPLDELVAIWRQAVQVLSERDRKVQADLSPTKQSPKPRS